MKCVCVVRMYVYVFTVLKDICKGLVGQSLWRMKKRCLDLKLKKSSGGRSHRSHKGFSIYSNGNREILKSCN